jgi:hypothetical protein
MVGRELNLVDELIISFPHNKNEPDVLARFAWGRCFAMITVLTFAILAPVTLLVANSGKILPFFRDNQIHFIIMCFFTFSSTLLGKIGFNAVEAEKIKIFARCSNF